MFNFLESFVLDVVEVLQLPCDVEGDVDGPGADGEGWGDVAFQGVAYHQQFIGQDTQVLAQLLEFHLSLVGGDLYMTEVFAQSAATEFVFLILQFSFGEHHEAIGIGL